MTIKKIIKIMIIAFFMILINTTVSNAAISASSKTINPGEKVQISVSSNVALSSYTVRMTSSGGLTFITSSGGEGAGSATITNASATGTTYLATYTFQAPTVTVDTTYQISFTATIMENVNLDPVPDSSTTATVIVKAPVTGQPATPNTPSTSKPSSNANLSNLGINPYDFRGFKASKTSYSVTVPKDVSSINIYAYPQDSKATVSGTGKKNLEIGNNTFKVTVRAEDGTTKVYVLYITRRAEDIVEETKSSDCALSALTVAEGETTPTFDPTIKEYTVIVPEEIAEVNITATPNSDTATVTVEGGKELQLGENIATITVVAEDGTTGIYTIKIIKANMKLGLQKLVIGYINDNGVFVELKISPELSQDVLEYVLEDIEYTIENLKIDAVANNEAFKIEIEGNEKLKEGKNTIIIKVIKEPTVEGEEIEEVEYKITVNKKAKPEQAKIGFIGKIKNWFTMIGIFIGNNKGKIIVGSLGICSVSMLGLSIYMVIDYKKYKMLLEKIATLTRANSKMTNTTLENKDLKNDDKQQ